MKLFFDADPGSVHWCNAEDGNLSEHSCRFDEEWPERVAATIAGPTSLDAVGYLLYNGGEEIRSPVTRISKELLVSIEKCIPLLPEHNEITLKTVESWMIRLHDVPHYLLCDTAFFAGLPSPASTYAVPYDLRQKGVRRYGGYGLCHQWAFGQASALAGKSLGKVVSIYLGNRTNAAAIKNGAAVETSIGFTPVEGIVSANSCGDVDPTVVFQLISAGMSLEEVNRLLSRESGIHGLLGKPASFATIAQQTSDVDTASVKDVLLYSLRKHVGAFVSVLGGIDAIVFTTEHPNEVMSFVAEVCQSLRFLGLEIIPDVSSMGDSYTLSAPESRIGAFCFQYNKWKTVAAHIRNFTTKEVRQ
jgi:acetate kinase